MKKLLAFLLCSTLVLGDSSGPTSGTGSGSGWSNPTNVATTDNTYATYSIPGETVETGSLGLSNQLSISSLGFALPVGATVIGIVATFEHHCSGTSSCRDSTIKLTKTAGVGQGTSAINVPFWATGDETDTLGDAAYLWGSTWTATEVNATGFGFSVIISNSNPSPRTASIDYMALTVYYSPSGSGSHRRVIISQTRTIQIHG